MIRKEIPPLAAGLEDKINPAPEFDHISIPCSACIEPSPSIGWRAVYGRMGVRA